MTTPTGMRPRPARLPRTARRAQLLEAAMEVFVSAGYHAAAMDDIAERAGVSKPVLYQHFPSKLELYLALLDGSCAAMLAAVRDALASTTDKKERVAATVDAFFAYVASPDAAFRLVFESDLMREPAVRGRIDAMIDACADAIAAVIHGDTGLPREQSRLLAAGLVGMAQVSARFWLAQGGSIPRDEAAELLFILGWRGIRGFPRADGSAG